MEKSQAIEIEETRELQLGTIFEVVVVERAACSKKTT